jgi:hypothetical protein
MALLEWIEPLSCIKSYKRKKKKYPQDRYGEGITLNKSFKM